ncbi:MAG: clan AA aspartic protease [Planctomycetes bacterium]|nr:clan AA aspartic protease [Planctomycetota bacterium]
MGVTHVTVRVTDIGQAGTPYEDEFVVDTGAVHCLAPAERLRAAGVQPEGKDVYTLANGEAVEYEYGFARLKFLGMDAVARIIFGPAKAEPLLGVLALEDAGIVVDPRTHELKRLHSLPLM